MTVPLGLAGFDRQTRLAHALTVCSAVVVFWIGYFGGAVLVYGDVAALATDDLGPQRVSGAIAATLTAASLSIAFVRGYGGPVLNTLVYPLAIFGIAPIVGRWLAFGPDPGGAFDRLFGFTLDPLVTALFMIVPAAATIAVVLTAWASLLDEDDRSAWERRHLPREFHEEFVDEES